MWRVINIVQNKAWNYYCPFVKLRRILDGYRVLLGSVFLVLKKWINKTETFFQVWHDLGIETIRQMEV